MSGGQGFLDLQIPQTEEDRDVWLDLEEQFLLNRWECVKGHVFEGNFYSPSTGENGNLSRKPNVFFCPACGEDMILSREEGAMELLNRIREFVGNACEDPKHSTDGSMILSDMNRLETTIKRLAEEAARP